MPKSMKHIVCINGSRGIIGVDLDRFINHSAIGCVVTGGAAGVDTLAEKWAKKYDIEWVCYLPQWEIYGKRAGIIRNKEMIDFADVLISFWDGKSSGTQQTIEYAKESGIPYQVHLVQELD